MCIFFDLLTCWLGQYSSVCLLSVYLLSALCTLITQSVSSTLTLGSLPKFRRSWSSEIHEDKKYLERTYAMRSVVLGRRALSFVVDIYLH